MVGPMSTEERQSSLRRLKAGVALLVGVSSGLIAVQAHATLPVILALIGGGTALGAAMSWYVFPSGDTYRGR